MNQPAMSPRRGINRELRALPLFIPPPRNGPDVLETHGTV
jgi:hypothetical protein